MGVLSVAPWGPERSGADGKAKPQLLSVGAATQQEWATIIQAHSTSNSQPAKTGYVRRILGARETAIVLPLLSQLSRLAR
jgi:hypothetical protein